jgi:hypothetical protein
VQGLGCAHAPPKAPPSLTPPHPPTPPPTPPPGPFLEKVLKDLIQETDIFLQAQASARYIAKDIASNVKDREEWLGARRRENEKRRAEGLEALPEVDASLPFFKAVTDKSGRDTLDTLLLSAQISSYCSSVTKFADQSFGKLFLASNLQARGGQ